MIEHLRVIGFAVLLSTVAAGQGFAQSVSTSTVNGRSITVIGGATNSIRTNNDRTEIRVDDQTISITPNAIMIDGAAYPASDVSTLRIMVEDGELNVIANGRDVRAISPEDLPPPLPARAEMPALPKFWYEKDGMPEGPIPLPDLKARIAAGEISADVLVWRKGMVDWASAQDILTE